MCHAVLFASLLIGFQYSSPDTLILNTGSKTGSYQAVGSALVEIINRECPNLFIKMNYSTIPSPPFLLFRGYIERL